MRKLGLRLAAIGCLVVLAGGIARADCRDETRRVPLDGKNAVSLKNLNCRAGTNATDPQVKVEFLRLSDASASLIVAKRSSALLKKTFGSPKVVENDVFRTFAGLLRDFGETLDETRPTVQVENSASAADTIAGQKLRVVADPYGNPLPFPLLDETAALANKTIPSGMRYYYSAICEEYTSPANTACKKYALETARMMAWRSMRADDVANYLKNLAAYNQRVTSGPSLPTTVPNDLKLMAHVAGANWPEDFVILVGTAEEDICADIVGWHFNYDGRNVALDVMLIENASAQPIKLDGLLGTLAAPPGLRAIPTSHPTGGSLLANTAEMLGPGQRLLVPIRIAFVPRNSTRQKFDAKLSGEIYKQRGASGYAGNTAGHGVPTFRDYAFGPEIAVSGLSVNGNRVDFNKRPVNSFIMVVAREAGSCPYLLSRDATDDDWTSHGKVLHKAPNKDREYTETLTFAGFKSRFRLEEREPEIAYIDHVELVVTLKSGETLTLAPDDARLAARDGDYLRLKWGEAAEFAFALPPGVNESDVTESRLAMTGYYERYSSLMAMRGAGRASLFDRPPAPWRAAALAAPISRKGPACMVAE